MRKEVAETKLAEYENDPRIESVRANIGRMRKHELVAIAQKELDMTYVQASNCTVVVLREMIKQNRKAIEGVEDPMKKLPKGFTNMNKKALIAEAKNRGLTLDQLSADKKDWNKLTSGELQLAIHNHVNFSNGQLTATPKNEKMTPPQKTSMSDDSSEEFQEICMEMVRQDQQSSSSSRRKRNA